MLKCAGPYLHLLKQMNAPIQLEAQMLRQLMSEAAAVPLHAMKEMQRALIAAQGKITKQRFEAQNALFKKLAPTLMQTPCANCARIAPNFRHSPEKASTSWHGLWNARCARNCETSMMRSPFNTPHWRSENPYEACSLQAPSLRPARSLWKL